MPQILDLEIKPGSRIGVWKIAEEPEELKWQIQWSAEDIRRFKAHHDGERSKHWLYSRILLRKMLNTEKFIELQSDEFGKPYLVNFPQHISISHSGDMVAVMLSEHNCGMDIQHMKPGIEKIAHKFISAEEWKYITEDVREEEMYLIWCGKEVLYKYYGRKSLAFKEDLFLYPFVWAEDGKTTGHIMKKEYYKELAVHWRVIEKTYLLAWAGD